MGIYKGIDQEWFPIISVDLTKANLSQLQAEADSFLEAKARLIHFEVSDGHFAPELTLGPPVIASIKTVLWKEVHLMIREPARKINSYLEAGANSIILQYETSPELEDLLMAIDSFYQEGQRVLRGVALSPSTRLEVLEPFLEDLDLVTLLTADPLSKALSPLSSIKERFTQLKNLIAKGPKRVLLAIEGQVNRESLKELSRLKADILVAGEGLFQETDPLKAFYDFNQILHQ